MDLEKLSTTLNRCIDTSESPRISKRIWKRKKNHFQTLASNTEFSDADIRLRKEKRKQKTNETLCIIWQSYYFSTALPANIVT